VTKLLDLCLFGNSIGGYGCVSESCNIGMRPIVCLKSDTLLKKLDNGNFKLVKSVIDNEKVETAYIKKSSKKMDSYVGYYADIDDDGTVDGIIYADLAVGNIGIGQYGSGNYITTYDIPKENITNLKNYTISTHIYTGQTTAGIYELNGFGEEAVIVPVNNSSGTVDRFYVMSLDDFTTSSYTNFYWYYESAGKLDNIISYLTDDFGQGKINTENMIKIWKNSGYGTQNNQDVWGIIKDYIYDESGKIIWFVPSKSEWSAFFGELGVTNENYNIMYENGFSNFYWSSSQYSAGEGYALIMSARVIGYFYIQNGVCVRLSTTF
jgi:hypothetical protein